MIKRFVFCLGMSGFGTLLSMNQDDIEFTRWRNSVEAGSSVSSELRVDGTRANALDQCIDGLAKDYVDIFAGYLESEASCGDKFGDFIEKREESYVKQLRILWEERNKDVDTWRKKERTKKKECCLVEEDCTPISEYPEGKEREWQLVGRRLYIIHEDMDKSNDANVYLRCYFKKNLQESVSQNNVNFNVFRVLNQLDLKRFISIKTLADFNVGQQFFLDSRRLLAACSVSTGSEKNGVQQFLFQKMKDRNAECSPEDVSEFFSHFEDGLLRQFFEAFEKWGDTPKLQIVLLHGTAGTGKTASFRYLFGERGKEIRWGVAVIEAGPGNSLVGNERGPGLFDILLSQPEPWRCLMMSGELSSVSNSLIRELIERLRWDEKNEEVLFDSLYFGMRIPVKNVVIACTSNCEISGDDPALDKVRNLIEYKKVKVGAFDKGYMKERIGEMYRNELEQALPREWQAIWNRISRAWNSSDESELSKSERWLLGCIRDHFSSQCLRDMACQKVVTFVAKRESDNDTK